MDSETARRSFDELDGTTLRPLRDELCRAAIRYASLRAEYALVDVARRSELEDSRTRAHDAFIDACNILSRSMAAAGEPTSWRRHLGDDRRELGDFACFVALFLGLRAR